MAPNRINVAQLAQSGTSGGQSSNTLKYIAAAAAAMGVAGAGYLVWKALVSRRDDEDMFSHDIDDAKAKADENHRRYRAKFETADVVYEKELKARRAARAAALRQSTVEELDDDDEEGWESATNEGEDEDYLEGSTDEELEFQTAEIMEADLRERYGKLMKKRANYQANNMNMPKSEEEELKEICKDLDDIRDWRAEKGKKYGFDAQGNVDYRGKIKSRGFGKPQKRADKYPGYGSSADRKAMLWGNGEEDEDEDWDDDEEGEEEFFRRLREDDDDWLDDEEEEMMGEDEIRQALADAMMARQLHPPQSMSEEDARTQQLLMQLLMQGVGRHDGNTGEDEEDPAGDIMHEVEEQYYTRRQAQLRQEAPSGAPQPSGVEELADTDDEDEPTANAHGSYGSKKFKGSKKKSGSKRISTLRQKRDGGDEEGEEDEVLYL